MYDVTNRESFKDVSEWLLQVNRFSMKQMPRILVGNKRDLESQRVVQYEDAHNLASGAQMKYHETSTVTGQGVK